MTQGISPCQQFVFTVNPTRLELGICSPLLHHHHHHQRAETLCRGRSGIRSQQENGENFLYAWSKRSFYPECILAEGLFFLVSASLKCLHALLFFVLCNYKWTFWISPCSSAKKSNLKMQFWKWFDCLKPKLYFPHEHGCEDPFETDLWLYVPINVWRCSWMQTCVLLFLVLHDENKQRDDTLWAWCDGEDHF